MIDLRRMGADNDAMSPADRNHARIALHRGWLTIEQVTRCKEAVEATGDSFLKVAVALRHLTSERARGLAPPTPSPRRGLPLPYALLLLAATLLLLGSQVFFAVRAGRESRRLERERVEARTRADEDARRKEGETANLLEKRKREDAENHWLQGRALLLRAEELILQDPKASAETILDEATRRYSLYLLVYPDDGLVLGERARVHELRHAYPDALRDLQAAIRADPSRAEAFLHRIRELEARAQR